MSYTIIIIILVLFYCFFGVVSLAEFFLYRSSLVSRKLLNISWYSTLLPNSKAAYLLTKSILDNLEEKPDEALAELNRMQKSMYLSLPFNRRLLALAQIGKALHLKGEFKKYQDFTNDANMIKEQINKNKESEVIWTIWEKYLNK